MVARDELLASRDHLEEVARRIGGDPSWLLPLINNAMDVAVGTLYGSRDGETYGIGPERTGESRADSARRWIRRSARASALLFGRLAFPAQEPPIELVDGTPITRLARAPDSKQASVEGWLEAIFRAMTAGDDVSLSWLTNIPPTFLERLARQNGERVAPYVFSLGALLASIVQRDGRLSSSWSARSWRSATLRRSPARRPPRSTSR